MDGQIMPSWLLLLTPAPSNGPKGFAAAYGSALSQSLQTISAVSRASGEIQVLDIALAYRGQISSQAHPRSFYFSALQNLLGQMYKLECKISTKLDIDIEYDNQVDVRVILFDDHDNPGICTLNLRSLAKCHRPWKHVFTISSIHGEHLLESFLQERQAFDVNSVRDLDIRHLKADNDTPIYDHIQIDDTISTSSGTHRHFSVAVGGTFDHLHVGHKLLLTMTALVIESDPEHVRNLTIGITGDSLLTKKQYAENLQDWEQRQESVRTFLLNVLEPDTSSKTTSRIYDKESKGRIIRDELRTGLIIDYVEIFDPFGPTITEKQISALVISGETRSGGKAINDRREEKGWDPLEIFEVDVLDTVEDYTSGSTMADFKDKISSTEIRRKLNLRQNNRSATTE